jgi:hypothetical protein
MSENAVYAYENGEKPKSKWTKKAMLEAIEGYCNESGLPYEGQFSKMKKDDIFRELFHWTSWHHTGKYANETDFYGLDEEKLADALVS